MIDATGIALIITSAGTGVAVVITSLRTNRKIEDVKKEVVTGNDRTIGQLQTSVETRRVRTIPEANRTARERRHEEWAEESGEE